MKYTVNPGDTLSAIAQRAGLQNYSGITGYKSGNPNLIYPGEQLDVPSPNPVLQSMKQSMNQSVPIDPAQATPSAEISQSSPSTPPSFNVSSIGVPKQFVPIFEQAAKVFGVPSKILAAIAKHESAGTFDPNINEYSGGMGRGMFQIDLGQHPDITEQQAKDPTFSAHYAASLLADAYKRYGNWDDAIKAYNAGDPYSNAPGYNGQPVSQLANQYLQRIREAMGS